MVAFAVSGAALVILGALVATPGVNAQAKGISTAQCLPNFAWANNTLNQNPCLVVAYLQAQCAEGTFTMNPLQPGYHYIGPTNDTSTQNPCICSTPVYMLSSACGACQNRTFISWTSWSTFCPAQLISPQGTYSQIIPAGTRVQHWAYLKPSDSGDFFDANAARLVGDTPESSQVQSSTSTTSSTTSSAPASTTSAAVGSSTGTGVTSTGTPTSSSKPNGGGGGSSHTGAIAGGVVGGVLGLALLALLGFFLFRNKNKPQPAAAAGGDPGHKYDNNNGAGGNYNPEMAAAGGGLNGQHQQPSYLQNQLTGPTVVSNNGSGAGYYNPGDANAFPQAQPYGAPQPGGGFPAQPGQPGYYNPQQQPGRYSGMPEV